MIKIKFLKNNKSSINIKERIKKKKKMKKMYSKNILFVIHNK